MFSIIPQIINENHNNMRVLHRLLRDEINPFNIPENRFVEFYRLPPHFAVEFIEELAAAERVDVTKGSIPFYIKVLVALYFYASGCYQRRVGAASIASMSQSSISRIICNVSILIFKHMSQKYIRFPQYGAESEEVKCRFLQETGLPGVIGIVDGTQIALSGLPKHLEYGYVNRKGYHSINTQIICDYDYRILSANARYAGSTHDSHVWKSSQIFTYLEIEYENNRFTDCWLLGDWGYPLQPWLVTPFRTAVTEQEKMFNKKHAKHRVKIENCIGILKQRFRCSSGERKLRYSHRVASHIIYASMVLHNFLINNNYNIEILSNIHNNDNNDNNENNQLNDNYENNDNNDRQRSDYLRGGILSRDRLINLLRL